MGDCCGPTGTRWGPDPTSPEFKELKPIAEALLTIKSREKREGQRRVKLFRGIALVKAILASNKKPLAAVTAQDEAVTLGRRLLAARFFHQASKVPDSDKHVRPHNPASSKFENSKDAFYVWDYEGDKTWTYIMLGVMLAVVFAVCLFPVWPHSLRVGAWYVSVTLLLFMLGFTIVRTVVFILSWLCGYSIWILPNVFDDDLSVSDSFKPLISMEQSSPGQSLTRVAVLGALAAMCYWVYTQPTEFDTFVGMQRQFVDDLYSGTLLSDTSQEHKDTLDEVKEKFETEFGGGDDMDEDEDEHAGAEYDQFRGADLDDADDEYDGDVNEDELMKELLEEVDQKAREDN